MICLPDNLNSEELLNNIRELSWDAAKIFRSYNQEIKNLRKLNIRNFETGPVTAADIEINELIKNSIKNKYPSQQWEFLSEEDKNTKTQSSTTSTSELTVDEPISEDDEQIEE